MSDEMANAPFSIFASATEGFLGSVLLMLLAMWSGMLLAGFCSDPGLLDFASLLYLPFVWFMLVVGGIVTGWGIISYCAIAICGLVLVHSDPNRVHLFFAVLYIQMLETSRFFYVFDLEIRTPIFLIVVLCVLPIAYPLSYHAVVRWVRHREQQAEEAGRCAICGAVHEVDQTECRV